MPQTFQTLTLDETLPSMPSFDPTIRRAPSRGYRLSDAETRLALKNALRYVPKSLHATLAPEFLDELKTYGRIYAYRFRPQGRISAQPIETYKGRSLAGKAFQLMIDNNLDFDIALYPYELITYGETGAVCQNWLQYRLIKRYLEVLDDEHTLAIASGHPLGLFPSHRLAPRVIITNALMVGLYDNPDDWERAEQLGVANYGQMTAGGWMYIGPQGIVHGTYNTILTAARMHHLVAADANLAGVLFVSSGLGGMSGAQPKAATIAGGVGVFAEVDGSRINTRLEQGWVDWVTNDLDAAFARAREKQKAKEPYSIAYHGNIVDLLAYAVERDIKIDLLSDQTSCHNVYTGGYTPQGVSFEERTRMLYEDRERFHACVDRSLLTHIGLIETLVKRGAYFFDYGNSFLKAVYDAGATRIAKNGVNDKDGFIFPSYVEDVMGPMFFDYGFGPFRWCCLSGKPEDLDKTDQAAAALIDPTRSPQDRDNYDWIVRAKENALVVGSQCRILYQDAWGRRAIALKFNDMVRKGEIGPVMLGRDHHDVSGTDSPFRETSSVKDGSNIMADMAVHCFTGNAARGMSLVALHNGGGVGIGKSINGGFGLVLDGSETTDRVIESAIMWDVNCGVARRAWARSDHAIETARRYNASEDGQITLPVLVDEALLDDVLKA